MKLPFLTKITRKLSGKNHHITEARTENRKLIFGFGKWMIEANLAVDPSKFYIGANLSPDPTCCAAKLLDICLLPMIVLHLEMTDFG